MIAKMKKYGIVSYANDFPVFLDNLQNLGLIDITQTASGHEGEERKILNWLNLCNDSIKRLESYKTKQTSADPKNRKATYVLKEYQKVAQEYDQIDQDIKQNDKRYQDFLPWGEYDPTIVQKLHKSGYDLVFYTCETRNFDQKWREDYDL